MLRVPTLQPLGAVSERPHPSAGHGGRCSTYEDLLALRAVGANLVVLSASGIQRMAPPFEDDASAALSLANAVQRAERAGLWVVIAIRTGPGLEDVAVEAQTPGLQSRLWID